MRTSAQAFPFLLSLILAVSVSAQEVAPPPAEPLPEPPAAAEAVLDPAAEKLEAELKVHGEEVAALASEAGARRAHVEQIQTCAIELGRAHQGKSVFNFRRTKDALAVMEQLENVAVQHGFAANAGPWSIYRQKLGSSGQNDSQIILAAFLHTGLVLHEGLADGTSFWKTWDEGDQPGEDTEDAVWKSWCTSLQNTQITSRNVPDLMAQIAPRTAIYENLRQAYLQQQNEWRGAEWPPIPDPGKVISVGDPYEHADLLAQRLQLEGYNVVLSEPGVYTEELAQGLEDFQFNHGLKEDGVLGPNSLSALNRTPEQRLSKLRVNLERARWLPEEFGERYVVVNIPSGLLRGFDAGKPAVSMRIVYGNGALGRNTPVMRDRIEYVVFRPYWNVPQKIAKNELLPKQYYNRRYFAENGYELVKEFSPSAQVYRVDRRSLAAVEAGDLHVRQRSGAGNALGKVKFIFPNSQNIYLHDTPEKSLFQRHDRGFSHGCIRLEKPDEFATYVLGWSLQDVHGAMNDYRRQTADVPGDLPVYIVYFTAEMMDDGKVRFFEDVYERDPVIAKELDGHINFAVPKALRLTSSSLPTAP